MYTQETLIVNIQQQFSSPLLVGVQLCPLYGRRELESRAQGRLPAGSQVVVHIEPRE
jgi:hypothetical protein